MDSKAFVKGTWGAEIVDDLAPAADDIVIEGKRGLDTFASTNLDFILRSKGVETVALGGFLTNCCVESTMRSAYEKGFDVVTLTDCVAATSRAEHENAIQYDYPMFSRPMTSTQFAETLHGRRGRGRHQPRLLNLGSQRLRLQADGEQREDRHGEHAGPHQGRRVLGEHRAVLRARSPSGRRAAAARWRSGT